MAPLSCKFSVLAAAPAVAYLFLVRPHGAQTIVRHSRQPCCSPVAPPIHVDGVLVTGERWTYQSRCQSSYCRAEGCVAELKAQTLTRIRVAAADEILLSYSASSEATEYVVKRSEGRWKPTGEITI
jgi:hypothetical protein